MKASSKPMSSPRRAEKYPPPLMRFLRTNVGSRSRGRSRSSPMFVRKKNAAIETQEPSSPKVTCIGQVRARRSGKKSGGNKAPAKKRHCWCVGKTLLCRHFARKLKPRPCNPVCPKWVLFFRFGFCTRVKSRRDSSTKESNQRGERKPTDTKDDYEDEDEEPEVKETAQVFISSTPPKNALILTRCRSAPYRSSSLANQFWGSPKTRDDDEEQKALQQEQDREQDKRTSKVEPYCRDSAPESKMDRESAGNSTLSQEFEASIREKIKENNIQGSSVGPPMLTRCKSEPARTGERLNPEATTFWGNTRLGVAESHLPHVCD